MLTVSRVTALVRDDETGLSLASAGLGDLTAKIVALREPSWLSQEDAMSVVTQIPAVEQRLKDGCMLVTGGAFRAEEALVGFLCSTPSPQRQLVVAVNLRTGQCSDATTGKMMESAEATRLARQLLDKSAKRKAELQAGVGALCRAPQ
jgi:hypothetical protein